LAARLSLYNFFSNLEERRHWRDGLSGNSVTHLTRSFKYAQTYVLAKNSLALDTFGNVSFDKGQHGFRGLYVLLYSSVDGILDGV